MLLSGTFLIPLAVGIVVSVILTFFPLVGTLGFEYSVVMGIVLAFISVFVSAELIDRHAKAHGPGRRLSDRVSSILILNIIILAFVLLVGFLSSLVKGDCYLREGAVFFLLIPVVSVFFASSLGLLTGFVFGRRGFLIGALIIIGTIVYSLWRLYDGVSLFVYNPVFGFFPGPIYDEVIPVTMTLVLYRLVIVLWGLLFLSLLTVANGLAHSRIGGWDFIKLIVIGFALVLGYYYKEEIGFSYSREYITENVLPVSVETDHFVIYYDPGSEWAKNINLIAEDHEWRYAQLEKFLEVDSDEKIRSYVYPDIDIRKKIVGAGETTIANPVHKEIHMIYDIFPHPILKHELTHVMAADFGSKYLKISPKIGLLEGLAVAADWSGEGYDSHQWAKSIIDNGMAPDIEDLVGFGFWYAPPGLSYTLMGSFSRYLIDTYGIEKFKTAYGTGSFSVYGKSLEELEAEWKQFLKGVYTPPGLRTIAEARFSEPSIFGAVCPRRVAALKTEAYKFYGANNFPKAHGLFEEALSYDGSNPELLNGLAYSYYYGGKYDEAIRTAETTASIPETYKTILLNLKGNALWQSGETAEAERIFRAVNRKAIPDDLKREIDVKLSAIEEGGESGERIKEFFSTRDRVRQAVSLEESIVLSPDYAPAYYLLGRMLYNSGDFEEAEPYLALAEYLGLPSDELTAENLRILGISLFADGDYGGAEAAFGEIIDSDEEGRLNDYSADFIDRSAWAGRSRLK